MPNKELTFRHFPMGRIFAITFRHYFGALTKKLEHLDLQRHYSVLLVIENSNGKCTQQYISDTLSKDKATMVKIIDHLVEMGFIKRMVNKNDRREHHIQLTQKAKKKLPEIHKAINDLNADATKGLSKKEVNDFYHCMDVIHANLQKLPAHRILMNVKKAR